jgi:hypothetical protein
MILLLFVASILVSVLLERQARQHTLERTMEYERLGIPVPPRRPKLKRTEAWLNVGLGFVLIGLSVLSTVSGFQMKGLAERMPDHAAHFNDDFRMGLEWGAFCLASGIALAWLGWKAIKEISRYESGTTTVTATPRAVGEVSRNTPPV